ncbi:hypothetical protein [Nonomuraea recticatena]|uniref:Uncharacterized protein n=1 Tax=Nonomuraea recticatena TaxID=46178 RepID=A0ABP6EH92_9ACTN
MSETVLYRRSVPALELEPGMVLRSAMAYLIEKIGVIGGSTEWKVRRYDEEKQSFVYSEFYIPHGAVIDIVDQVDVSGLVRPTANHEMRVGAVLEFDRGPFQVLDFRTLDGVHIALLFGEIGISQFVVCMFKSTDREWYGGVYGSNITKAVERFNLALKRNGLE